MKDELPNQLPDVADLLCTLRAGVRDGNYDLGDHPAVMNAEAAMEYAANTIDALLSKNKRMQNALNLAIGLGQMLGLTDMEADAVRELANRQEQETKT